MAASPQSPPKIGALNWLFGTSIETGITATAGGGQAGAYALTAQLSRIDTVGTGDDSVGLPKVTVPRNTPRWVGLLPLVSNTGASALQHYGATPDTING